MTDNERFLLKLVRAGMGFPAKEVLPKITIQMLENLYQLASDQTVVGLAIEGLEKCDISSAKGSPILLEWIGMTTQTAARNELQIKTVGDVYNLFAQELLPPVVMKGTVVAQEYPNPLSRIPGDIDLYFTPESGKKAVALAKQKGLDVFEESERDISFHYKDCLIEIHPYVAHQALQKKYACDQRFQKWCEEELTNHYRTATIGYNPTEIHVPSVMMTLVYGFYHLWIHFVRSGIGLRHLCDWVMCLHNYHGQYDEGELKKLLRDFGLFGPWEGFSGIAVDYLGLPSEEMPFYRKTNQAEKILNLMFKEGNFGHKEESVVYSKNPIKRIFQKVKYILLRYRKVGGIFPKDVVNFLPSWKTLKKRQ